MTRVWIVLALVLLLSLVPSQPFVTVPPSSPAIPGALGGPVAPSRLALPSSPTGPPMEESQSNASGGCTVCIIYNVAIGNIPSPDLPSAVVVNTENGDIYEPLVNAPAVSEISFNATWAAGDHRTTLTTFGLPSFDGVEPNSSGAVYDPVNGNIYIAESNVANVTVFSTTSNSVVTTIPVLGDPTAVVYDPENDTIFVADSIGNALSVIDGSTNQVVVTVPFPSCPLCEPQSLVMDTDNGNVFVGLSGTPAGGWIQVLNGTTYLNVTTIDESQCLGGTFDPVDGDIYYAFSSQGEDYSLAVISGTTDRVVNQTLLEAGGNTATYDPVDGDLIVSGNPASDGPWDAEEIVLNASTGAILASVPDAYGVGEGGGNGETWSSGGAIPQAFDPANGYTYIVAGTPESGLGAPPSWWTYILSLPGSVPTVSGLTAQPTSVNLQETTNLTLNITGGDTVYDYSYYDLPPGCVSQDVNPLPCRPTVPGIYHPLYEANDSHYPEYGLGDYLCGVLCSGFTIDLTVLSAPIATILPTHARVDSGETQLFRTAVAGGGGPYVYAYSPSGSGAVCLPSSGSEVNCTSGAPGTAFSVSVRVTDVYGVTFSATSADVAVGPALSANITASTQTPLLGETMAFNANGSGGSGAPYSFAYIGLPPGCVSLNRTTIGCLPTQANWYNVSVVVTDGVNGTANASVSIHVVFDFNVVVPASTPLGQQLTILVDSNESFSNATTTPSSVRTDGGVGTLTYAYSGLPPGCSSEDVASLTCTPSALGTYPVLVSVHDQAGDHNQHTVTVHVIAAPGLLGLAGYDGELVIGAVLGLVITLVAILASVSKRRSRRSEASVPKGSLEGAGTKAVPAAQPDVPNKGQAESVTVPKGDWESLQARLDKLESSQSGKDADPPPNDKT